MSIRVSPFVSRRSMSGCVSDCSFLGKEKAALGSRENRTFIFLFPLQEGIMSKGQSGMNGTASLVDEMDFF